MVEYDLSYSKGPLYGSFYKAFTGSVNIAKAYTKIYFSSWQRLLLLLSEKAQKQQDGEFFNPFRLAYGWPKITDEESSKYLKSNWFLESLDDYVKGILELSSLFDILPPTKVRRYPSLVLMPMTYETDLIHNQHQQPFLVNMRGSIQTNFEEQPHTIVYTKEDTRLLNYIHPSDSKEHSENRSNNSNNRPGGSNVVYKIPLLIVYAPINRYHIMDLTQGRSIVEKFASAGFNVFLLDWGLQTNNKPTISDYVGYIKQSIDTISRITKSNKVSLLGYSWGGVLSMMYAATQDGKDKIQNLIIQSSQADFDKDNSILAEWVRNLPVKEFIKRFGMVDCYLINQAFLMRNPAIRAFDIILYALAMNQPAKFLENLVSIMTWLWFDVPYIPGPFFEQFVEDLYKQNLLIQKKMSLEKSGDGGTQDTRTNLETIDLSAISVPLLNIVGDQDDLIPAASSIPLNSAVSSKDKQLLRFPTGHVELCIGAAAHEKLWPQAVEWLQKRS